MSKLTIQQKFKDKLEELEANLAYQKGANNCAASTLTNILDVIGIEDFHYYNMAIPLAGGFGGFRSKNKWKGPCGAVCGGCAAIGIILGGQEKIKDKDMAKVYLKAAEFVENFEEQFGSTTCQELCGIDFGDPHGYIEYTTKKIWEKICHKYVIWAIKEVQRLCKRQLKKIWS
ncbi:MAG: putative redox-active protein [Promethearchaeota archaeon]|nr:MAG: putative redox-active protein [Candidatus Lokiarchaeota archaeon]